jgi:hypothetical protein
MKRLFALVALVGVFTLSSLFVRGQDEDEPRPVKKSAAAEPIDPFDRKHERTQTASNGDLELLKKHSIDTANDSLVDYFRRRSLADADRAKVTALIPRLGSLEFRVREKATDDLLQFGPATLSFLRQGAKQGDLELLRRAEACIDRIRSSEPPAEVTASAVRVLSSRNPSELAPTLLAYLPYAESEFVSDEVRSALRKVARKDGHAHPELVTALTDALAPRRAAAGEALAGVKGQEAAVKKLLADADPLVRLRVAEAFVLAGEKSAVPVLIEALPLATPAQACSAEDILQRIAEGHNAPQVVRVGDAATRAKFKDAWTAWWTKNEKQIVLAKLHETPAMLGHTLVVLLDEGRIRELNAKNETVWQIEGVVFPLDVQPLANGNVLVAEYHAGRVTERDRFRGEIKWEKAIGGPLMAQRLPNRNTFIATDSQCLEVDEKGNEVLSFTMPGTERLMKVTKLPNSEIVALTSEGRIIRMDEKGKELHSFDIDIGTKLFGGRLHVSPNGRVLVPHNSENKVVEYDAQGQSVWEVNVTQPVAATKLPNGHVLVTTMNPQTGAMEFDRMGRETEWNYRQNTRVTRALRR